MRKKKIIAHFATIIPTYRRWILQSLSWHMVCNTWDMKDVRVSFAAGCYFSQREQKLHLLWLPGVSVAAWGWLVCKASWCAAFISSCIFCFFSFQLMMQDSFWLASAPCRLGLCESTFRGALDYRQKFLCSALHDEEDGILACFHVEHLAVVKHGAFTLCSLTNSAPSTAWQTCYLNVNPWFERELLLLVQTGNV